MKMPGKVTCEKLHYSAEVVGNLTRTHIEVHVKLDDGSEKIFEGKGQAIMPNFASSTVVAWKSSDHDKWHGECTGSLVSLIPARPYFALGRFRFGCRSGDGLP
jgi:hypothetical protein